MTASRAAGGRDEDVELSFELLNLNNCIKNGI